MFCFGLVIEVILFIFLSEFFIDFLEFIIIFIGVSILVLKWLLIKVNFFWDGIFFGNVESVLYVYFIWVVKILYLIKIINVIIKICIGCFVDILLILC